MPVALAATTPSLIFPMTLAIAVFKLASRILAMAMGCDV
jgi:hypothetical protein